MKNNHYSYFLPSKRPEIQKSKSKMKFIFKLFIILKQKHPKRRKKCMKNKILTTNYNCGKNVKNNLMFMVIM